MRRVFPGLALCALVLAACGGNPSAPSAAALDQDFDLRPGESAAVVGGSLVVRFVAVPEDSRCPVDAQCVWSGDASVRLLVRAAAGGEQSLDLHTHLEPVEATLGEYRILLRFLSPLPRTGRPIAPRDYVATLRVVRSA